VGQPTAGAVFNPNCDDGGKNTGDLDFRFAKYYARKPRPAWGQIQGPFRPLHFSFLAFRSNIKPFRLGFLFTSDI